MDMPTKPSRSAVTQRLAAFLAAVAAEGGTGDAIANAAVGALAGLTADALPPPAQQAWREIARALRASPDRPLSDRSTDAVRSWPQARLTALVADMRGLHDILQRLDNDRWEDEIRDKLRHSYL